MYKDYASFLNAVKFVEGKKENFALLKKYRDKYLFAGNLKPKIQSRSEEILRHYDPDFKYRVLCSKIISYDPSIRRDFYPSRDLLSKAERRYAKISRKREAEDFADKN